MSHWRKNTLARVYIGTISLENCLPVSTNAKHMQTLSPRNSTPNCITLDTYTCMLKRTCFNAHCHTVISPNWQNPNIYHQQIILFPIYTMGWMRMQQWELTGTYINTNEPYKHVIKENFRYKRACAIWIYLCNIKKWLKLICEIEVKDIDYLKEFNDWKKVTDSSFWIFVLNTSLCLLVKTYWIVHLGFGVFYFNTIFS